MPRFVLTAALLLQKAWCDGDLSWSCDCSCHDSSYPSYPCGPGWTDFRCNMANCEERLSCFDGGDDNFGCSMLGDHAGPCCNDPAPEGWRGPGNITDWSCDCSCHDQGYFCGPGGTDSRCDAEGGVCRLESAYCYQSSGCQEEAGPCCNGDPPPGWTVYMGILEAWQASQPSHPISSACRTRINAAAVSIYLARSAAGWLH
ncbi:unnamed protein product [Symbiodinium natans]|uniref:Uncharacterized protein n=1 Tax=Symbiodinium natans TaxID=878477 RepID=A0A812SEK9_9DINO|nr:unnamed protein product [Symbiodinium natans]